MTSIAAKALVSDVGNIAPMTLGEALQKTSTALNDAGIAGAFQEARLLLCHVFNIDTIELIGGESKSAEKGGLERLAKVVERRLKGEPVSRITGTIEFYGLAFKLSANTLVPRSDTGTLVDGVLADLQSANEACPRVLDIGTGTGAIIISILHNVPKAVGTATDIDSKALEMARLNTAENGVADRLKFVRSDWCGDVEGEFDIIVSNPPYIETATIAGLAVEVKSFDPLIALDGGKDGLDAYRNIFTQCSQNIAKNGRLYLEIGYDQCEAVVELATQTQWKFVRLIKDLGANDRVLVFAL